MDNRSSPPEPYPVVRFIVSHKRMLPILITLLVLIGGTWGAVQLSSIALFLATLGGSVILLGILLSYVEILSIIADTLIPKY